MRITRRDALLGSAAVLFSLPTKRAEATLLMDDQLFSVAAAGGSCAISETWSATDNVNFVLTNSNKTATQTNSLGAVRSVSAHNTGKLYLEMFINAMNGNIFDGDFIGFTVASTPGNWTSANSFYVRNDGLMYVGGVSVGVSINGLLGNTIGFAIDLTNQKMWCRNSSSGGSGGNWTGATGGAADPATNLNGIDISAAFGVGVFVYAFLNGDNTTTDSITLNTPLTYTAPVGFTAWCSGCTESAAFIARTSGLNDTHIAAYDTLICGLVADGIWAKLDVLYVYATQNQATALLNLVSTSFNGTIHGSPVFAADQGFTGVASSATDYISTGFNPTTQAGTSKLQQNAGHLSMWSLTNSTNTLQAFGAQDTGPDTHYYIFPKYTDNNAYFRINANGAGAPLFANADPLGHYIAVRNGVNVGLIKNGYPMTSTQLETSQPVINREFYAAGLNANGTPIGSNLQVAAASVGGLLTDAECALFYRRLCDYMTSVSVPGVICCPEADAFLARTSGLDYTHAKAYYDLICGLVTDGVWANLDVLHIYATQNSATSLLNLVSTSYAATLIGAPTFTVDRGYTGVNASSTVFIDTHFAPATATSPKYTINSSHYSAWSVTNIGTSGFPFMGNLVSSFTESTMYSKFTDNNAYFRIDDNGAGGSAAVADSQGFYHTNRSSSSNVQGYKNGAAIFTSTTDTALNLSSNSYYVLGYHSNITSIGSANQVAMASLGASLNGTQALAFYNRLRTYMTAVGVP